MKFTIETTYDKATLTAFQKILNGTIRAKRILLVRVFSFVVAGLSFIYGLIWLITGIQLQTTFVPAVSGFLMSVVFLFIGFMYKSHLVRQSKHLVNKTPRIIRYSFDENGYITGKGKTAVRTPYTAIKMLCCNAEYSVLMLDRRRGFVIDHGRFLRGNPDQFREFLEKATGRTFQVYKES